MERDVLLNIRWDVFNIYFVVDWKNDFSNPCPNGPQNLLLHTTNRQHASSQCQLARHRHITSDLPPRYGRHECRCHGDSGRRTVLGNRPSRDVNVNLHLL